MQIFKVTKDQPKLQNLTFLKKKKIIEEDFEDFIQINRHKLGNKVKIIEMNPKAFSEANYPPIEDKIQIKKEILEQDSSDGLKEESVSVITDQHLRNIIKEEEEEELDLSQDEHDH